MNWKKLRRVIIIGILAAAGVATPIAVTVGTAVDQAIEDVISDKKVSTIAEENAENQVKTENKYTEKSDR